MFGWKCILLCAVMGKALAVPLVSITDAKDSPEQPRVSYSRDTIVKGGTDATLDCAVEGLDLTNVDNFRIDWSKIDEEDPIQSLPITSGDILVYNPNDKYQLIHPEGTHQYSLKVKAVAKEDTGLYRCLVYFAEDQFVTPKVYLDIEEAPSFSDPSLKHVTVTEGDSLSFDCKPAGVPKPETSWERVHYGPTLYGGSFAKTSTISLPSVKLSDQGRYACHADNGLGVAKTEIVLTVEYAPRVTILTADVGADVNEQFSLECRVDSLPEAEITWYKGEDALLGDVNIRVKETKVETPLSDAARSNPILKTAIPTVILSTITISKVNLDVLGEYSCSASNKIGTKEATADLNLKTPPEIISQSSRRVFYLDEDSPGRSELPVSIDCKASGVPAPEYKWTRNNKPLVWQSNPRYSLDTQSGSLLIEDPMIADNGWYQCIAYNVLGVAKSDPIYFFNASRVEFDFENSQSSIKLTAEEGRPFKMICPNATSDPVPEVTWVIATPADENGQTRMQYFSSNRTVVGPDGTAYFSYVKPEDDSEKSGHLYLCVGKSEALPNDLSIGTTVTLKVVKPEDGMTNGGSETLNIEPFLVYGSKNETKVTGGQDTKLWCIFGGEPEPAILWSDKNGLILSGDNFDFDNYNSTLIIKNTNTTHQGSYRCSASNGIGLVSQHLMNLTVDMPPIFSEELQKVQVEEGAKVRFFCGADGDGVVTYNWYFNGREITVAKDVRRKTQGNELIIEPALTTDTGNYACNATSSYGYAYGQTTLVVLPGTFRNTVSSVTVCPDVEELKMELASVKETLESLKGFVQTTRTAQADASIVLIQRIAGKLDLLTQEEKDLIAAQDFFKREQEDVNIKTSLKKQQTKHKPYIVKSEQKDKETKPQEEEKEQITNPQEEEEKEQITKPQEEEIEQITNQQEEETEQITKPQEEEIEQITKPQEEEKEQITKPQEEEEEEEEKQQKKKERETKLQEEEQKQKEKEEQQEKQKETPAMETRRKAKI